MKEYTCYIFTVDKAFWYELEIFLATQFVDVNYEIVNDITSNDYTTTFGEIYEDIEVLNSDAISVKIYVQKRDVPTTEMKFNALPKNVFLEKTVITYSEKAVVKSYQQPISLTSYTTIIYDKSQANDSVKKYIILQPKNAFGTGSHATTKLAAELLEKHLYKNATVLDIGCGTGVLAIVAALSGASEVLAIDYDIQAIKEARAVIRKNKLTEVIKVKKSNLLEKIDVESFDIIIANLSIDIFEKLLPDLVKKLIPKQLCIFSGIQVEQKRKYLSMLSEYGKSMEIVDQDSNDQWYACVIEKIGE